MRYASLVATGVLAGFAGSVASADQPCPACAHSALDPDAIKALERMCDFLRARKEMSIQAVMETDDVLANGQKIQLSGVATISARRPDRLRVEVITDRGLRDLYYDGKTLTLYAPQMGYYAVIDAPATLRDLVEVAAGKYGIEVPVADLFFWGSDQPGIDRITSAIDLGSAKVGGLEAEHYAFRQPGVDWQVWIQKGPQALPLKLALTTTSNPARPQHVVYLSWNLAPTRRDLSFVSPRGAKKIKLQYLASRPATEPERSGQGPLRVSTSADTRVDIGTTRTSVNVGAAVGGPALGGTVAGTVVETLPSACVSVYQHGYTYERCGSVWYQPQYLGTSVSYVIVAAP